MKRANRILASEKLEERHMLASDWQNPGQPLDTDRDVQIAPLDALIIINALNRTGSHALPERNPIEDPFFYDTDGNSILEPKDAILVINALNRGKAIPAIGLAVDAGTSPGANRDLKTDRADIVGQISLGKVDRLYARMPSIAGWVDITGQLDSSQRIELSEEDLKLWFYWSRSYGKHRIEFMSYAATSGEDPATPDFASLDFSIIPLAPVINTPELLQTSDTTTFEVPLSEKIDRNSILEEKITVADNSGKIPFTVTVLEDDRSLKFRTLRPMTQGLVSLQIGEDAFKSIEGFRVPEHSAQIANYVNVESLVFGETIAYPFLTRNVTYRYTFQVERPDTLWLHVAYRTNGSFTITNPLGQSSTFERSGFAQSFPLFETGTYFLQVTVPRLTTFHWKANLESQLPFLTPGEAFSGTLDGPDPGRLARIKVDSRSALVLLRSEASTTIDDRDSLAINGIQSSTFHDSTLPFFYIQTEGEYVVQFNLGRSSQDERFFQYTPYVTKTAELSPTIGEWIDVQIDHPLSQVSFRLPSLSGSYSRIEIESSGDASNIELLWNSDFGAAEKARFRVSEHRSEYVFDVDDSNSNTITIQGRGVSTPSFRFRILEIDTLMDLPVGEEVPFLENGSIAFYRLWAEEDRQLSIDRAVPQARGTATLMVPTQTAEFSSLPNTFSIKPRREYIVAMFGTGSWAAGFLDRIPVPTESGIHSYSIPQVRQTHERSFVAQADDIYSYALIPNSDSNFVLQYPSVSSSVPLGDPFGRITSRALTPSIETFSVTRKSLDNVPYTLEWYHWNRAPLLEFDVPLQGDVVQGGTKVFRVIAKSNLTVLEAQNLPGWAWALHDSKGQIQQTSDMTQPMFVESAPGELYYLRVFNKSSNENQFQVSLKASTRESRKANIGNEVSSSLSMAVRQIVYEIPMNVGEKVLLEKRESIPGSVRMKWLDVFFPYEISPSFRDVVVDSTSLPVTMYGQRIQRLLVESLVPEDVNFQFQVYSLSQASLLLPNAVQDFTLPRGDSFIAFRMKSSVPGQPEIQVESLSGQAIDYYIDNTSQETNNNAFLPIDRYLIVRRVSGSPDPIQARVTFKITPAGPFEFTGPELTFTGDALQGDVVHRFIGYQGMWLDVSESTFTSLRYQIIDPLGNLVKESLGRGSSFIQLPISGEYQFRVLQASRPDASTYSYQLLAPVHAPVIEIDQAVQVQQLSGYSRRYFLLNLDKATEVLVSGLGVPKTTARLLLLDSTLSFRPLRSLENNFYQLPIGFALVLVTNDNPEAIDGTLLVRNAAHLPLLEVGNEYAFDMAVGETLDFRLRTDNTTGAILNTELGRMVIHQHYLEPSYQPVLHLPAEPAEHIIRLQRLNFDAGQPLRLKIRPKDLHPPHPPTVIVAGQLVEVQTTLFSTHEYVIDSEDGLPFVFQEKKGNVHVSVSSYFGATGRRFLIKVNGDGNLARFRLVHIDNIPEVPNDGIVRGTLDRLGDFVNFRLTGKPGEPIYLRSISGDIERHVDAASSITDRVVPQSGRAVLTIYARSDNQDFEVEFSLKKERAVELESGVWKAIGDSVVGESIVYWANGDLGDSIAVDIESNDVHWPRIHPIPNIKKLGFTGRHDLFVKYAEDSRQTGRIALYSLEDMIPVAFNRWESTSEHRIHRLQVDRPGSYRLRAKDESGQPVNLDYEILLKDGKRATYVSKSGGASHFDLHEPGDYWISMLPLPSNAEWIVEELIYEKIAAKYGQLYEVEIQEGIETILEFPAEGRQNILNQDFRIDPGVVAIDMQPVPAMRMFNLPSQNPLRFRFQGTGRVYLRLDTYSVVPALVAGESRSIRLTDTHPSAIFRIQGEPGDSLEFLSSLEDREDVRWTIFERSGYGWHSRPATQRQTFSFLSSREYLIQLEKVTAGIVDLAIMARKV